MYNLLRPFLFRLDPEQAHTLALTSINLLHKVHLTKVCFRSITKPTTCMGLTFPNAVGLAAGFDKNGDYIDALATLGFGFIEIGTVTPLPQVGNPKPRLFRLAKEEAIINRMGFNNKGIDYVARRLEQTQYRGILGINVGKNKDTPLEKAADDYLLGLRAFWKYASYVTINISSPNTPGLRDLQQGDMLTNLLCVLKQEQRAIFLAHKKYVPLVVKISPDMTDEELQTTATVLLKEQIDGVIATNTTVTRAGVEESVHAQEAGGLSGKPLQARNTQVIAKLHALLQDKIPIIASGGIMDAASAKEKINAGASLVQLYSGLIYAGPNLIRKCTS